MFDILKMISAGPSGFWTLKTEIGATTAPTFTININPAPKYQIADGAGGITSVFMTELPVAISPNIINTSRILQAERFWLNSGVEQADGSANYTVFKRGRLDTWIENPATDKPTARAKRNDNRQTS